MGRLALRSGFRESRDSLRDSCGDGLTVDRAGHVGVEEVCGLGLSSGHEMLVEVHCDRDVGAAHEHGDRLRVRASGDLR